MIALALVFFTAFFVVMYATPPLIKVAILKRLFDEPGERKIHTRVVPTIGGVIIFAATFFSFALWYEISDLSNPLVVRQYIGEFRFLISSALLLFFVGLKDDIIGTAPVKKLAAHVIVGLILVIIGNVRITSLYGIFEIYEIPYWGSVCLSLFTYIVVVNAINLIDGVDGLAGGVGFIASLSFATWFYLAQDYIYASLSLALAGSLLGFLVFNFSPAKLFMGDSGSLTIGLILCMLSIKLIEYPIDKLEGAIVYISKPVFVIAILIYPLTDTLRVFLIRTARGVSPFSADRNHLHHRLIDCGLNHRQTVAVIYTFSAIVVILSVLLWSYNPNITFMVIIAFTLLCVFLLHLTRKSLQKKRLEFQKTVG